METQLLQTRTVNRVGEKSRRAARTALRFRPITPDALPLINSIIQESTSRTCDYTIGGIYMWIDWFEYQYAVYEDTLFIKGVNEIDPTMTAFSMPIGPMPLARAVKLIKEYCEASDIEPMFSAIPEDRIDYFLSVADADVEELVDWADYLYDARALAQLKGKKYNKKRNHVNRFIEDNPNYVLEPINHEILPEVLLFHTGLHTAEDKNSEMALYEKDRCTDVLNSFNSFPFEGAVLRDESGEICAYTVGEVIGDTLYLHIEKMNHEIAGAGEAINRLFAAEMVRRHPGVRFINREEDGGDPGLRRAKESYNPVMRLRKFNLYLK